MVGRMVSGTAFNVPVCDVVVVPKDIDRAGFSDMLRRVQPCKAVVYVENRPGFSGSIGRTVEAALANTLAERQLPHDIKFEDADPATVQMIQKGLEQGIFDDTHRIASWIGRVNELTGLGLKLLVVHSRHHSGWLLDFVKRSSKQFAGFIFSGSAYMLSEEKNTQTVRDIRALMRICLDRPIPMLGICFGMHVAMLEAFGVCVEYLTVPEGMTALLLDHHEYIDQAQMHHCERTFVSDLTPGQRLMVYGLERINRRPAGRGDPIINLAHDIGGGEIHCQGVLYPHPEIPDSAVIATSRRLWYRTVPRPERRTTDLEQRVIEVVKLGKFGYATQLHPELPPELLWVLTYLPSIANELREEGYDPSLIRKKLARHMTASDQGYYAGQRFGYNFIKRILTPHLIERLFAEGSISFAEYHDLTKRLGNTNPTTQRAA